MPSRRPGPQPSRFASTVSASHPRTHSRYARPVAGRSARSPDWWSSIGRSSCSWKNSTASANASSAGERLSVNSILSVSVGPSTNSAPWHSEQACPLPTETRSGAGRSSLWISHSRVTPTTSGNADRPTLGCRGCVSVAWQHREPGSVASALRVRTSRYHLRVAGRIGRCYPIIIGHRKEW